MAQPLRSPPEPEAPALPARQTDVLRVIGFLQLQYGDPADAVILFDALRTLFPSERRVTLSLALARLRAGEPRAALDVLDDAELSEFPAAHLLAATEYDPLGPCHHLLRAQALAALGRMAESARAMRLFIRQRRLFDSRGIS